MSYEIEQAATNNPEFMIEPENDYYCPACGCVEVREAMPYGPVIWCRCRDCGMDYYLKHE